MIVRPSTTANPRCSQCSPPQIDTSEQSGLWHRAVTKTGVRRVTSAVIAMGLTVSTISNTSIADVETYQEEALARAVQLSTSEILMRFSDTLDRGAVQNGKGISAETRWLASGRFETRWWRQAAGAPKINVVSGSWKAEGNERCVLFNGAPQGEWQCNPVYQRTDGSFVSLNDDGSVHGIHYLLPLELSVEDPH